MKSYLPHQWKFLVPIASLVMACSPLRAQDSDPGSAANPLVVVVAPDPIALEGTSSGAFTLIRFGSTSNALAVNVKLSGTASNGVDYVTISNVITIPAGSLATDVQVTPIVVNHGNKTVIMAIETNSDYRIGEHHWAEVKIIDDVFDFLPPTVTLTAPTNSSVFTNPPSITLTAVVSDPGVTIKGVSFYANDDFLGRETNSPYSLVWSNPPGGHFVLFARAVDQFDRSVLSAPVHITITDIDPVVNLTSPANGQNFMVHQNIKLAADASDPDTNATIASVRFYANDHLLGTKTNMPYSLVWSNAPSGFFFLRAVATDSKGDKGYSKPVLINVSPFELKRRSL
jgi:Big-like domain-containing protein